ncbi:conserved hypothetical protein [Vibrio crassostreae]|nr:conserved hypothetical protein [Vibrio crassostreae]
MLPFTDRLPFPFYWKGVHFVSVQKQTQSVRQLKNTSMTPQNWKQHVSRNRGLKYAKSSLFSS